MKVQVRGRGSDGKRVEAEIDLPSTARVGDTFVIGLEGEQEEVEILGFEKEKGLDGAVITTVVVGPRPAYGWAEAPHRPG